MILGTVNVYDEAILRLIVRGMEGRAAEVEFVIDTEFTEYLSLPADLISALGLPYLQSDEMMLSDGTVVEFSSYAATVARGAVELQVIVQAGEGSPLLRDHLLTFPVRAGETVTVSPLS